MSKVILQLILSPGNNSKFEIQKYRIITCLISHKIKHSKYKKLYVKLNYIYNKPCCFLFKKYIKSRSYKSKYKKCGYYFI